MCELENRLNDESLSLARLRQVNVERCEDAFHPLNDWSPTDWATAAAGEMGEACNLVKKLRRLDGADKDQDSEWQRSVLTGRIAEELADTVIYIDLLAARLGCNLSEAIVAKFNHVSSKRGSKFRL